MKLAEAQALSDIDLLQYIQAVVTFKPLVQFAARVHASTNTRGDGGATRSGGQHFRGHSRGPREADAFHNHREGAWAGGQ